MDELAAQIKQLELKLLHTDWRANPAAIHELLGEAFEEIGSNGQTSVKQEVVDWLLSKDPHQKWVLQDFRIKRLAEDMVIAIYCAVKADQAEGIGKGSIRSSIWQRCGNHWKIAFHQATKQI